MLANDLKTHVKLWVVSDKPAEELGTDEEGGVKENAGEGSGTDRDSAGAAD